MRINPVNNSIFRPEYSVRKQKEADFKNISNSSVTMPDNYGRAMVFKSTNPDIVTKVMKASFDDKLAVALSKLKIGEILVSAPNSVACAETMKKALGAIKGLFSCIYTLEEPSVKEQMLFLKHSTDSFLLFNAGEHPLVKDTLDLILPNNADVIECESLIKFSDDWHVIQDKADVDSDLSENSSLFLKTLDCSKFVEKSLAEYSRNVITALEEPEKKDTKRVFTFSQVGGQDKTIEALKKNILYPLKYPEVFEGFMLNRGAILYGPPGTGKTLLAQALASESGASVFQLCATDLADKWVGSSEKNCRELFEKAIDAQPSIIYFDEIDALGKRRGGYDVHGDKLLTQLLSLVSDLEKRGDRVFVIGSTNRKDDLDPAFMRSGRFSLQLEVGLPDLKGTRQILDIHTKGKPISEDVDKDKLAEKMYNKKMSGADIAAAVKEAFSNALERCGIYKSMEENRYSPQMKEYLKITEEDFDKAISGFKSAEKTSRRIGYNK